MAGLTEQLLTERLRPGVVEDCAALVDTEVKKKKGPKGLMIRGAYATVKTIKRGFVPGVVDALLDDWMAKLEPYYEAHLAAAGGRFGAYLLGRRDEVAESLLEVTDARAKVTKHKRAAKLYFKLRPSAKSNVVDALPGLTGLVDKYLDAAAADA